MADTQIPIVFQHMFHDEFIILSQQKNARLWETVRDDPDYLQGIFGYFDRLGATEAQEGLPRNADTPNIDVPHSRRRIGLVDVDWGKLVDKQDAVRMGRSDSAMATKYAQLAMMAMNRKKDDKIINALGGNAVSIDENLVGTNVPLPAAQKIAVGGTGLTLAKLLTAREILDGADVDEELTRYFLATAKNLTTLLNTTEVKSADYNTVRALVEGKIDTFLGFKFKRTERLKLDATPSRLCYGYVQGAIGAAVGIDAVTRISERADKRHATQAYVMQQIDATRIEEVQVVEVACNEV